MKNEILEDPTTVTSTLDYVLNNYLMLLYTSFQSDISILSQVWLYIFILPAILYLIFFYFKWLILTTPIWLPISMILSSVRPKTIIYNNKESTKKNTEEQTIDE